MPDSHYVDRLFEDLPEIDKLRILREGGIFDDRPDILRGHGGRYSDLHEWMDHHREAIVPLLLRTRDLSDNEIAHLVSDGDLRIEFPFGRTFGVNLRFSLINQLETERQYSSTVLLSNLAAASAMMMEMFVVIGGATKSLGVETPLLPPQVQVESGSVEIAVGGGLFGSGIGLIVACAAGLIAAPLVGPAAGVVLASAGVIELALGWKQKIAETEKTKEETRVLRINHNDIVIRQSRRLRELEIQQKEIELEKAKLEFQQTDSEDRASFPASGLVQRDVVIKEAREWGLSEAAANHVLNRGLPTYTALRRYFAEIHMK